MEPLPSLPARPRPRHRMRHFYGPLPRIRTRLKMFGDSLERAVGLSSRDAEMPRVARPVSDALCKSLVPAGADNGRVTGA
jgi:hypothetical protein